jgi:hypothetical protein
VLGRTRMARNQEDLPKHLLCWPKRSVLEDHFRRQLSDARFVRSINLPKGELRAAAGEGRIHTVPICVVKGVKSVCPELQTDTLIQRECLCHRNVRSVLSWTSYGSKTGVSTDILRRYRERRSIELTGKTLTAVTQIRVAGNEQFIKTCAVLRARTKTGGTDSSASVVGRTGCPGTAVNHREASPDSRV